MKAQKAVDADALKVILDDEKAKGNPRLKNGHGDWHYGGLVRASDGRIPYESAERAERHGRVRCQAVRGIEITNEGTIQIAGAGELHVVGRVRPRGSGSVREVSIQETNMDTPRRPNGPDREREFVVLVTFNIEHVAGAPTPVARRTPPTAKVEPDDGAREHAMGDADGGLGERQSRWSQRRNRRRKDSPEHGSRTNREGRPKGRARSRGRQIGWESERY